MSAIRITVNVLAGTSIAKACTEAIALANHIGVTIEFHFNGVTCIACKGDTAESLEAAWGDEMKSDRKHKFARGGQ